MLSDSEVKAVDRLAYAQETKRLANDLYGYILIHPIKWWQTYREVKRRLAVQGRWHA